MQKQPVNVGENSPVYVSTPANLIAEHKKIKAFLKQQSEAFAEFCKPHNTRMTEIESELHERLLDLNGGEIGKASLKTDEGTAYLSTIVTPKIVDKTKYLDWVLEDWDNRGGMLQIGAPVKAEFDAWIEQHGSPPPNTETSSFTRVNIRAS